MLTIAGDRAVSFAGVPIEGKGGVGRGLAGQIADSDSATSGEGFRGVF